MATEDSPLIKALRQAVSSAPEEPTFRVALAEALIAADATADAVIELGEALRLDPTAPRAKELMLQALGSPAAAAPAAEAHEVERREPASPPQPSSPSAADDTGTGTDAAAKGHPEFDWSAAEDEVRDFAPPPRFAVPAAAEDENEADSDEPAHDVERPNVTLADVGGMEQVKERLEIAFLAPMRNPDLRKLYGKSLRGGLLLYGPPGCGKTFVARAVAGELGASFIAVGIAEVLDMWVGRSEQNLHELFQLARRKAPSVLFFDEVDALGQRRSQLRSSSMRTTVNQFLAELDSVDAENDGVFVLGATNAPWDVDPALRRPGRFDRTVLVTPPDAPARGDILRYHVRDRPIAGIDLDQLVAATDGYSGADLAHLCESAAEFALLDSVRSGEVRMVGMPDFERALRDVKPSTGPWIDAARSVALFANEGGAYDDLVAYLKKTKSL